MTRSGYSFTQIVLRLQEATREVIEIRRQLRSLGHEIE